MLTNYPMFCHNVSYTSLEALGSLHAWNQNNELKLLCAPDISSKYLKVPMDSLVLETAGTQQGLRPGKGIEPAHARCLPISVFCWKPSPHCSTSSRSVSYRCSFSLLTAVSLWAIPWLKQALVDMCSITLQHSLQWWKFSHVSVVYTGPIKPWKKSGKESVLSISIWWFSRQCISFGYHIQR